jgi:S-adenosylmethionine synthetase
MEKTNLAVGLETRALFGRESACWVDVLDACIEAKERSRVAVERVTDQRCWCIACGVLCHRVCRGADILREDIARLVTAEEGREEKEEEGVKSHAQ